MKGGIVQSEYDDMDNFAATPFSYKTPNSNLDTNNSIRQLAPRGALQSQNSKYSLPNSNRMSNGYQVQSTGKTALSKASGDQSFQQNQNIQNQVLNQNNQKLSQKKPLYSMVPEQITKNLSKENQKKQSRQTNLIFHQEARQSNNENINILLCEESELLTRKTGASNKLINLTPNKKYPVPMSPTLQPVLSTTSSNMQNQSQRAYQNYVPQSSKSDMKSNSKNTNSEQKPSVQYNEFKYYTNCNEINSDNYRKYINISNQFQRKSDILSQNNFELSPCEHKIFEVASPKYSLSGGSYVRANSLKKQVSSLSNQIGDNRNYQLQLKSDSLVNEQDFTPQQNVLYEIKIKELQDYVSQLENDLKQSQQRNVEIQKKGKEKSFIQSFDKHLKSSKHLSDTEDSLILSEKKAMKRSSLTGQKQGNQNQNQQQSTSSIVDVKIRPISCSKQGASPQSIRFTCDSHNKESEKKQLLSSTEMSDLDDELEYQVDNLREGQIDEMDENDPEQEQECESCERLKQLVFQAKEAIDDLKAEIEEWRELCAVKDTELRQIHHRLYNDLIGTDKKTQFKEENQIREFDPSKPVETDKRIKNFIQKNKKRIMTRSKSKNNDRKYTLSAGKKSALKDLKDFVNEETQFYEAEDQAIQTSFELPSNQNDISTITRDLPKSNTAHLHSASPYTNNLDCLKENDYPQFSVDQRTNCLLEDKETFQTEELLTLRTKTFHQEQEVQKLRNQVAHLTKQCESFVGLVQKVKRKNKKQNNNIDINELKQQYDIVSNLESYSILEKINEWKREEGIDCRNGELQQTQIPRPMKLLQEITAEDLEEQDQQPKQSEQSPGKDFRKYIQQEQESLKKLQEMKLKEFQKQQQEYLQFLKGVQ